MYKTKIFAAYLPQFHEISENNEFWGEGYTDWVAVKKATPQYKGHVQPKVPLNENYYDLSDLDVLKWQAELAQKYRITGFNIYHYWFKNGKKVLEKPAENLLNSSEIDLQYFFTWANGSWVNSTWSNISGWGNPWAPALSNSNEKPRILLEFDYEDYDAWNEHFQYLLPFFKDDRYLKIDSKPVFAIMEENDINKLKGMVDCWNRLAKENGFTGMFIMIRRRLNSNHVDLDGNFIYQPTFSAWGKREAIDIRFRKYLKMNLNYIDGVKYRYDYDKVWHDIIRYAKKHKEKTLYYGSVVNFDDTPRRGKNAHMLDNSTPQKFENYFYELYKICCERKKEVLFLTAWNEWGEGSYLEPDMVNKYAYLEAVKKAVERYEDENTRKYIY